MSTRRSRRIQEYLLRRSTIREIFLQTKSRIVSLVFCISLEAFTQRCIEKGSGRCVSPSGFGSAEETNERFKFLLDHGQTGLSLAFDLPTQTGRDSDDSAPEGEVGRTGVAIKLYRRHDDLL